MVPNGLSGLAQSLLGLLYPNACLICDAAETDSSVFRHGLCDDCHTAVASDPAEVCPHCAATVGPHTETSTGCPACRPHSFAFESAVRLGQYEGRLREAVLRMKNSHGEPLAELMGRVLAESKLSPIKSLGADVVVPVPLHWRQRWSRGYNQAEALARGLAGCLGVDIDASCLRRVQPLSQHAQPSATARRENIRGGFQCRRRASLAGKTVLVVDDVMTTGSTAGAVARVIRQVAARVHVVVLARA